MYGQMRSFTSCAALFVLGVMLVSPACGRAGQAGETRTLTKAVELDNAESVDVALKMGAGELNVSGGAAKLVDATFRFNVPSWEPILDYQGGGTRARLRIEQPETSMSLGHTENHWDLRLNDTVPIDLTANLGAGEAVMTLGTLNLRNLEIHLGAGQLNLDLRGTPRHSYDVRVHGGVGSAKIHVPRSVGVVATASGGIGSIDVQGLEKRGNEWYNREHEQDPIKLTLDVKGGVGEIVINAEP
jgi:hypothetical protein